MAKQHLEQRRKFLVLALRRSLQSGKDDRDRSHRMIMIKIADIDLALFQLEQDNG